MKKEKTKLKKLDMTSVDLVRRGANQKADIMLYKSATPEDDIPQDLKKGIMDVIREWWNGETNDLNITKSAYYDAIDYSIESILTDDTVDDITKAEMVEESIDQFAEAMKAEVLKAIGAYNAPEGTVDDGTGEEEQTLDDVEKNAVEGNFEGHFLTVDFEEGEEEMKIDKSRFTPEELDTYQALIAKGLVEDEEDYVEPPKKKKAEEEEVETEKELHPEVKKALEEVAEMKKNYEMRELHSVAKKYSVLGKDEDKLAETLYTMKKSSPEAYDNYVAILEEQVEMVEKSGMFEEIGKSGHGAVAGGSAVSRIEAAATEIQKADPTMSRVEAVAKAWDQHPEILAEYEREYQGGK